MTGTTTWFFGLPCSGKTTLAEGCVGPQTVHLDGDYLRENLSEDLGFTEEDRTENLRRAAGVAQALNEQDFDVAASFITPYCKQRSLIADTVDELNFVYTDAPRDVCEDRDVKGMWQKAKDGEIDNFTGVDGKFEEPERQHLRVETDIHSQEDSVKQVCDVFNLKSEPSTLLLGRWQPFHDGHRTVIDSFVNNGKRVVIGVRDTELSEKNPFTVQERISMLNQEYEDVDSVSIMPVPDIETVGVGREVGYSLVQVPDEVKQISGTDTRDTYSKKEMLRGEHRQ